MRLTVIAVAFLFILPLVIAQSSFTFTVDQEAVRVKQGGKAAIGIMINSSVEDRMVISVDGYQPWMTIYPTQPQVRPGLLKGVDIFLEPGFNTTPGTYALRINIYSMKTKELKSKSVYVTISPEHEKKLYLENVMLGGNPAPGGNITASIKLKNYKDVPVSNVLVNVDVKFSGDRVFNYRKTIPQINPSVSHTVKRDFSFEKSAPWGSYVMNVKIVEGDEIVGTDTRAFRVVKLPILANETVTENIFLGYKTKLVFKNEGNYPSEEFEIIREVDKRFYTGPEPIRQEGNKYVFVVPSLSPNESYVLEYDTNYWQLIFIPIVIIIVLYLLFFRFKAVIVKKFVMQKKEIDEGNEFTIGVELKNKSGHDISNGVVKDFVPSVFKIKEFVGSKPSTKKTVMGTELTWKVGKMPKDEIRIIGYKLVPVFGVSGRVRLPKCDFTFKLKQNKKTRSSSRTGLGA